MSHDDAIADCLKRGLFAAHSVWRGDTVVVGMRSRDEGVAGIGAHEHVVWWAPGEDEGGIVINRCGCKPAVLRETGHGAP